ncbi:MAG: sodium/glutamate symporter, partial [Fusobacterium sp.]
MNTEIFKYTFGMPETLAIAVALLLLGRWIKEKVTILKKFFIPAPVVGGLIFSIVTLIGHEYNLFQFSFDSQLKSLLMLAFFTTIGFAASIKMLLKGGLSVMIFLVVSIVLIIIQNVVGVTLCGVLGIDKLLGLAAGSIALTGGHGTAAAFGPELVKAGAEAGVSVSVAAATFGLVAGCMIGGPIAKR